LTLSGLKLNFSLKISAWKTEIQEQAYFVILIESLRELLVIDIDLMI
jgi:hypothetical protein